jgi:1,4-dihydroxy-2-naphthoyl-CoA hydrolase
MEAIMDTGPDDLRELGRELRATHPGLDERMGIEFLEATPERVVARMPVHGNNQAYGTLHGGASCVLAETTGSLGAAVHAGPGRMALGIEISATHHRTAASGHVTAVATPVHLGRTLATFEVVISDERGRRICTARVTSALREHRDHREPREDRGDREHRGDRG